MNTYTRKDLAALNWASTLIEYRGAVELIPSRVNRLGLLVQRAAVGDEITTGHLALIEWVAYELGQQKLVESDQPSAILFDRLSEKLGLDYLVANQTAVGSAQWWQTRTPLAH